MRKLLFFSIVLMLGLAACSESDVPVTGVRVDQNTLSLVIGETGNLTATVLPENATNRNVVWTSNNTAVATVNASGTVTAVSEGTATITVTTADGGHTATSTVTVTATAVAVTGVTKSVTEVEIVAGNTETLIATIAPADATNQNLTWSSDDETVAEVDAHGVVTAVSAGTAIITVTTVDGGHTATTTVTVNAITVSVTGVTLTETDLELVAGNTETLIATSAPADATNKNVMWSSDNETVATVNTNGVVTAVSAGTATITVTTVDGDFTATATITVTPATVSVTGVTLNETALELIAGETEALIATIAPADATNKNVMWSSDNKTVATVNANGVVTAVSAGTATITVTTEDGDFTATATVTVSPIPVTFESLTANGTAGTVLTTILMLTFDREIPGLTAANITLSGTTGATAGAFTHVSGGTYTLAVSGITEEGLVNVSVAQNGFVFTPASLDVTVHVGPTVTFHANNGNAPATVVVPSGATVAVPAVPRRQGLESRFLGWFTDNGTFENAFDFDTPITGDITLYANWTTFNVGDIGPAGGRIVHRVDEGFQMHYLDGGREASRTVYYLEVAPQNSSTGHLGTNNSHNIASVGTANATNFAATLGRGQRDTQVLAGAGATAAQNAQNARFGGFDDWFLPSMGEMERIRAIGGIITGSITNWWTSTQNSNNTNQGWRIAGTQVWYTNNKNLNFNVRAVRAF
jgi:uncharacterized protein YjdB